VHITFDEEPPPLDDDDGTRLAERGMGGGDDRERVLEPRRIDAGWERSRRPVGIRQGTSDGCGGSGRSDAAATAFSTSAKTSTTDDANDAIALRASDNMAP
jgi:hypothetical protein